MRKCILVLFVGFYLISCPVWATHIVGGELALTVVDAKAHTYNLALNLYFDVIRGNVGAEDRQATVAIYSKRNNTLLGQATLTLLSREEIVYTNPVCTSSTPPVRTRLLRYEQLITLSPSSFNDALGYYAVWERCCRNGTITNIQDPGGQGNTFYLEFPPVSMLNSSPVFTLPKGDFACVKRPFSFDFSANDADGDELRYSLVTPYSSRSDRNNPILFPTAFPYPSISWNAGFSLTNVIPGSQPLRIDSNTGRLSFTPNTLGLYVFSVLCQEYRGGVKIGEVRRDFQLLVIDCPFNAPPKIVFENKTIKEGDSIVITANQLDRCVGFNITDSLGVTATQKITMKVINASNLSADDVKLSLTSGVITSSTDILRAQMCWGKCLDKGNEAKSFEFDIVTTDDGCPQPLTDTLHVKVNLDPIPNDPPEVSTDIPGNNISSLMNQEVRFTILGNDPDKDPMILKALGDGFNLADLGMQFASGQSSTGVIRQPFAWTPDCRLFQVKPDGKLRIAFLVQDEDCINQTDTVYVNMVIKDIDPQANLNEIPNVFTPNGDSSNELFTLSQFLPRDNCSDQFQKIEVYNRWGLKVFESTSREFSWDGKGFPTGIYYYYVTYRNSHYKGTVSLLR